MSYIKNHILQTYPEASFEKLHLFDWQLITLTAFLVKLDGQYSFFEANKIKKTFLHFFTPDQQILATEAINKVAIDNLQWTTFISEIKNNTPAKDCLQLLSFLFEIACVDGVLGDEELSFLHSLSQDFGITQVDFMQLLDNFKMWNKILRSKVLDQLNNEIQNDQQQLRLRALTLFGLPEHVSIDQIKKRYRELIKKHHPDAHPHLTASEMIFHKEQMFKINKAYDILV